MGSILERSVRVPGSTDPTARPGLSGVTVGRRAPVVSKARFGRFARRSYRRRGSRSASSSEQQAYKAIAQLEAAGFVQEITGRKRDRVWVAAELLAELDDLDRRIQAEMGN